MTRHLFQYRSNEIDGIGFGYVNGMSLGLCVQSGHAPHAFPQSDGRPWAILVIGLRGAINRRSRLTPREPHRERTGEVQKLFENGENRHVGVHAEDTKSLHNLCSGVRAGRVWRFGQFQFDGCDRKRAHDLTLNQLSSAAGFTPSTAGVMAVQDR